LRLSKTDYDLFLVHSGGYCPHCNDVTTLDVFEVGSSIKCVKCGAAELVPMKLALSQNLISIQRVDLKTNIAPPER
jgi:Zn ribbon nucleic-acid-binding protein